MTATRMAADTLELRTVDGAWLTTSYELAFRRSDQPLHAGDVLERPGLRIEIVEATDGHPIRIRSPPVPAGATPTGDRRHPDHKFFRLFLEIRHRPSIFRFGLLSSEEK